MQKYFFLYLYYEQRETTVQVTLNPKKPSLLSYSDFPVSRWLKINHTTPKEFENEDFTLKTHQMFPVYITPDKL